MLRARRVGQTGTVQTPPAAITRPPWRLLVASVVYVAVGVVVVVATRGVVRDLALAALVVLLAATVYFRMAALQREVAVGAAEADRAAQERVAAQAEAQRARLDAELSRTRAGLLSAVSHNLRTPLSSIQTASSVLLSDNARLDEDERRELLETIYGEAGRLSRLVAKVLDLGRIRAGGVEVEPRGADVEGLCQTAFHRVRPLLGTRPVVVAVEPDAASCEIDPAILSQVLANLIENALRYTPNDSALELRARRQRGSVELRLVDHGPGVAPEDRERIFEEFYRAGERSESEGTGLGLAIVRALVTAHRGRVWVEPTEGGGATFVVRIPVRFER